MPPEEQRALSHLKCLECWEQLDQVNLAEWFLKPSHIENVSSLLSRKGGSVLLWFLSWRSGQMFSRGADGGNSFRPQARQRFIHATRQLSERDRGPLSRVRRGQLSRARQLSNWIMHSSPSVFKVHRLVARRAQEGAAMRCCECASMIAKCSSCCSEQFRIVHLFPCQKV